VVYADFPIGGENLVIATTHLDSMEEDDRLRVHQLQTMYHLFNETSYPNVILLGDFGFYNDKERTNSIVELKGFKDVWVESEESDVTYDLNRNTLLQQYVKKDYDAPRKSVRRDLVLLRSNVWQFVEAKLIGTDPIRLEEGGGSFISTHFGVCTRFKMSNKF